MHHVGPGGDSADLQRSEFTNCATVLNAVQLNCKDQPESSEAPEGEAADLRPLHTKRQRQLMAMFPSILGVMQCQC